MTWEGFSKHVQSTAYWVLCLACPAYGLLLADLPDLKIYKVLNLLGVVWNILGLLTISYLLSADERFQLSALRVSSFLLAVLLVQLPFGIAFGAVWALLLHYPSAKLAFLTGSYLIWPGVVSFFLFDGFVTPKPKSPDSTRAQVSFMGGYFLLSGLLAQLCGAFLDLIDFNG
jgi:hypothetical protein